MKLKANDTICALATGNSINAIGIIRISGKNAINIVNTIFSKDISKSKSHTTHFGIIEDKNKIIDEVLVTVFKINKSYTGEETVEISCHGSIYIKNKILNILVNQGCRIATAGEFTMRAFRNGKLDLSQAESVADLIASESEAEQQTAINQLRGGFSNKLKELRKKLIDFASLIELELDFSEEDIEFADRKQLTELLHEIKDEIKILINSFSLGNAIKNGIPVAILGAPNVGKSTLLNTLLNEEKAIVSDIAGTTRDAIEDKLIINGISFRFIDTAGIRDTNDKIENLGIKKTLQKANQAKIILFVIDPNTNIKQQEIELKKISKINQEKIIPIINKIDLNPKKELKIKNAISISAKENTGVEEIKQQLLKYITKKHISNEKTIITNARHYEELKLTLNEINEVIENISNDVSSDLYSINIRKALDHLGSITGEVTNDTLLGNIFSKFCIGK